MPDDFYIEKTEEDGRTQACPLLPHAHAKTKVALLLTYIVVHRATPYPTLPESESEYDTLNSQYWRFING